MSLHLNLHMVILDSLNYSSKAESPINGSAKAVISRNLTTSQHNRLFIFLFILYICRKQALSSYLHSDNS